MSEEAESGPGILDAHRELVSRIEQSTGRMRVLAIRTIVVAAFLTASYLVQLALPLTGTTSQTVNLADPTLVATEVVVLALAMIWLYLGVSDLRFTGRAKRDIRAARAKERQLQDRMP
jgi:hypothetical protein